MDLAPAGKIGGGPFRQIPLGRWVEHLQQGAGSTGIADVEPVEGCHQSDQEQQPLQIQQAGVAVQVGELAAPIQVHCIADPLVEAIEMPLQQCPIHRLGRWIHGHQGRKAFAAIRAEVFVGQRCGELPDHGLGHLPFAVAGPGQAGRLGGCQPPADPLHRPGIGHGLGVDEAPGPAGVGGIDDHRDAGGDPLVKTLQQPITDLRPGALDRRIAEQLGADHIGGEHQARLTVGSLQQGCQLVGQGGLAAAWGPISRWQRMGRTWRNAAGPTAIVLLPSCEQRAPPSCFAGELSPATARRERVNPAEAEVVTMVNQEQGTPYRAPDLLRDVLLIDMLELTGSTAAAARVLSLSQPTVSRRYRALAQDLGLERRPRQRPGRRFGESSCLRLLRKGLSLHRWQAGVLRVGGRPEHQQQMADYPWLHWVGLEGLLLQAAPELIRNDLLDGLIISEAELSVLGSPYTGAFGSDLNCS